MDPTALGGLAPADVLTVAGAAILNAILVGVLFKAWSPAQATKERWGPLVALAVGVILVEGFTIAQGENLLSGLVTGILVGGGSSGFYDLASSTGVVGGKPDA